MDFCLLQGKINFRIKWTIFLFKRSQIYSVKIRKTFIRKLSPFIRPFKLYSAWSVSQRFRHYTPNLRGGILYNYNPWENKVAKMLIYNKFRFPLPQIWVLINNNKNSMSSSLNISEVKPRPLDDDTEGFLPS